MPTRQRGSYDRSMIECFISFCCEDKHFYPLSVKRITLPSNTIILFVSTRFRFQTPRLITLARRCCRKREKDKGKRVNRFIHKAFSFICCE